MEFDSCGLSTLLSSLQSPPLSLKQTAAAGVVVFFVCIQMAYREVVSFVANGQSCITSVLLAHQLLQQHMPFSTNSLVVMCLAFCLQCALQQSALNVQHCQTCIAWIGKLAGTLFGLVGRTACLLCCARICCESILCLLKYFLEKVGSNVVEMQIWRAQADHFSLSTSEEQILATRSRAR